MVELIDTIMSIPSCLQDQQSKIQVVNKWIKEHKNYENNEATQEENKGEAEGEDKDEKNISENKDDALPKKEQDPPSEVNSKEDNGEEIDTVPEVPNSTKRRKNSRTLIKNRSRIKKLKEVDNNIKSISIYQNLEKEEGPRPKLLYKEYPVVIKIYLLYIG